MRLQKTDIWRFTKKKRVRLKGVYSRAKKEVNEQFGRKTNQDVDGNRKLLWKEMSKVNKEKEESIADKGWKWVAVTGEDEV